MTSMTAASIAPKGANAVQSTVPTVLRVWGTVIAGANALGILFGLVSLASGNAMALVSMGIAAVFIRMGLALREGSKQAVYGLCVLGSLACLPILGLLAGGEILPALIFAGIVGGLYGVPIVAAFRSWDRLS